MQTLWQDLRYGARMLIKQPGFTLIAVLTLALSIGANAAIFSLVDAVLLKMLPIKQPEQLWFINHAGPRGAGAAPPYPCFERFRDHTSHLSGIAAFSPSEPKVSIDGQIERIKGQFVSGNYFSLLGVRALIGRAFAPSDDAVIGTGGPDGPVAVIGYHYWQRRFAFSPEVIGKVIQFGKTPVTIIGVTPPEFSGLLPGRDVDINLPMMLADTRFLTEKSALWFYAVGRLKPGSSVEQARAELDVMFQAFINEMPVSPEIRKDYFDHLELIAAGQGLYGLRLAYSEPLLTLMVIVGLVLLITCANVANLLLARATARRREFALRLALGASRLRLVRLVLSESLLLVSCGGLLGLLLARWGSELLVGFITFGRDPVSLDLSLDSRLLLFTLGLSLLTGIIFSLVPAWRSTRLDPSPALKENSATSGKRSRSRFGKLLVVMQVALSLLLLIGAGLFIRSLQKLKNLDFGFQPDGVLTMRLDPAARDYQESQLNRFWREMLTRVKAIPGVSSASISLLTPLADIDTVSIIEVPGFSPSSAQDNAVRFNQVSPEYFTTMGILVLQGRSFNEGDNEAASKVALLNDTAARFYFGDRNPIGAKIRVTHPPTADPVEIIGVVKDTRHRSLRDEIPRILYRPVFQSVGKVGSLTLAVRTSGDPAALAGPLRNEMRSMGPDILVTNVITLNDQVNQSLMKERLIASLSSLFGLLALLLACIGLYGVISYDVARRTREIGIRMALGAQPGDVLKLVIGQGMRLALGGVGGGLVAAYGLTRLMTTLLFGVRATDPLTFAFIPAMLLLVALLACWLPTRRAAKVDTMVALRHE